MTVVTIENLGRFFHHADDINMFCQNSNGSGHREPAVHEKILSMDTGRKYSFDHGFQMPSGLDRSFFSSLMRTAAFVHGFLAVAQTLFRIGGGEQRKIQRQATDTVGPAYGEHPKAFQIAPGTVIANTTEQFHQLGPRAVVRAVIDDEHLLSIFVREAVEKAI